MGAAPARGRTPSGSGSLRLPTAPPPLLPRREHSRGAAGVAGASTSLSCSRMGEGAVTAWSWAPRTAPIGSSQNPSNRTCRCCPPPRSAHRRAPRTLWLIAERPNHVWALDFQFDQTADGRGLKLLNIVDEHTREALAVVAAKRINADATAATLDRIVAGRGTAPGYIRYDNGPELTTNALHDWCRFSGTDSSYIEPGAPWENQ